MTAEAIRVDSMSKLCFLGSLIFRANGH